MAAATPGCSAGPPCTGSGSACGCCPRTSSCDPAHGVGRDWPLSYVDLEPYYREAEWEIGVSADVADQAHLGIQFPDDYDYPMHALPPSYSDQVLGTAVDGMTVTLGAQPFALRVRSYPAARNSMPRDGYDPVGAVDERGEGQALARDLGQRCQGNTSCTPICPVQAKYNAQKFPVWSLTYTTASASLFLKPGIPPASGTVRLTANRNRREHMYGR